MHDMNVMPYGADDERNAPIDDAYEREVEARAADVAAHNLSCAERAQDEHRASVSPPLHVTDGYYTFGDTPALHRTKVSDIVAAGWHDMPTTTMHGEHGYIHIDAPSVHADAFDNDTANGRSEDGS